ncbi:MAG: hypothetical protein HC767_14920 [Akkermansiaceae bacterium]|nr:hypothetical protein [Akkermansiaceae bacterium]
MVLGTAFSTFVSADTIAYWDQNSNGLPGGSALDFQPRHFLRLLAKAQGHLAWQISIPQRLS